MDNPRQILNGQFMQTLVLEVDIMAGIRNCTHSILFDAVTPCLWYLSMAPKSSYYGNASTYLADIAQGCCIGFKAFMQLLHITSDANWKQNGLITLSH